MAPELKKINAIDLRTAGLDEKWLQAQIREDPALLGLGQLEIAGREHRQPVGGRIDFLMLDPESETYYEVEVMLGTLDESHIIRTIEYWDVERQRRPQFDHRAVIVAEQITSRFFNVLRLLNRSVPMIAVQLSAFQLDDSTIVLHPVTVLDVVEEIAEGTPPDDRTHTREEWVKEGKWTLDAAESLLRITSGVFGSWALTYAKYYVAINVDGSNYMLLHKRSSNKSLLTFRMAQSLQDEVAALLDAKNITYVRKPKEFYITVDKEMIDRNAELFSSIAVFVKKSWDSKA